MPLYPLPSIIAFLGWLYILVASGLAYIFAGLVLMVLGVAAYLWHARGSGEWPYAVRREAGADG
jgi:hypothetical protein